MDLTPLDRLLARGHALQLRMDGEGADVDDTGAMVHPGWGPYVQATLTDHTGQVVADTSAATAAGALTALQQKITTTRSTERPAAPKDRMGVGRLIDDTGRITELWTDSQVATPSPDAPGYRQAWGWITSGDPKIGRGQQVRLELPDGTVLQGKGSIEVERHLGRRHLKVYIHG
ncbi:hypothetical protein [Micrococcus luteus]|uniref:hypothetical protein n=1 Tax=Micrococcus luteus TaxID=1270 RepID=UPI003331E0D3